MGAGTRADFQQFWAVYPRRAARLDALKAWTKLDPSPALLAQILAALEWQVGQPDWVKERGRFVPLPATWIRGERWLDEHGASERRPVEDWWAVCKRLHDLTCGGQYAHELRMQMDAVKHP